MQTMIGRFMKCWQVTTAVLLAAVTALSSCINDDQDDCGLLLRFRYDYNVKMADAFPEEVKNITVFVFDADGNYVRQISRTADSFGKGYSLNIRGLKPGRHTLVCFARDSKAVDEQKDFVFTKDIKTIDDLTSRLATDAEGVSDKEFAALYVGETTIDVADKPQHAEVSLMKVTNRLQVVLFPPKGGDTTFKAENFDVTVVDGTAAWLDHKGEKVQDVPVTYKPFSQVTSEATAQDDHTAIDRAVIAQLNVSRLFTGSRAKLVIRDKRNGNEVFNGNLAWLLALSKGANANAVRHEWSDQEYLDRQDTYYLQFFANGDWFFNGKVIVNGWVINDINADLGGKQGMKAL